MIVTFLKNLFKVGKLLYTIDAGDHRFGMSSYLGKTQKIMVFSPYGLMHCPPDNSMVIIVNQGGKESNGIGIADDPKNRTLKGLSKGEVALGNYLTGNYIYFDKDGLCTVVADNVTIVSTDVEITSDTLTHNGTNVGDSHVHPQGADSDGDTQQNTGGPQ